MNAANCIRSKGDETLLRLPLGRQPSSRPSAGLHGDGDRFLDGFCGDNECRVLLQIDSYGLFSRLGDDHRSRMGGRSSIYRRGTSGFVLIGETSSPSSSSSSTASVLTGTESCIVEIGTVAGVGSSSRRRRSSTGLDEPRMDRGARGAG